MNKLTIQRSLAAKSQPTPKPFASKFHYQPPPVDGKESAKLEVKVGMLLPDWTTMFRTEAEANKALLEVVRNIQQHSDDRWARRGLANCIDKSRVRVQTLVCSCKIATDNRNQALPEEKSRLHAAACSARLKVVVENMRVGKGNTTYFGIRVKVCENNHCAHYPLRRVACHINEETLALVKESFQESNPVRRFNLRKVRRQPGLQHVTPKQFTNLIAKIVRQQMKGNKAKVEKSKTCLELVLEALQYEGIGFVVRVTGGKCGKQELTLVREVGGQQTYVLNSTIEDALEEVRSAWR